MMLGSLYADGHSNNSFFQKDDPTHKFNPTHTNRMLREAFTRHGIEINTADVNVGREVDFELHFEGRALQPGTALRFLVALENPYINPLNASPEYFDNFRRVYTWNRRLIGRHNVEEIAYGVRFDIPPWPRFEERRIFSCLINANKGFKDPLPNDLYIERISVIRWYERHAPADFALYGLGWNKPRHESTALGQLKRRAQRLATQLFSYRPFPSWKGEVADKSSVLLLSKFSYCYENSSGLSGYVTEKLIDCMLNGCVPVYWGADDITEFVPTDCFIDRRQFRETAEVHAYLRAMSPDDYHRRQEAIKAFLAGAGRRFSAEHFSESLASRIASELQWGCP
jgi:alpha(1,3/1,4) fucosyltransferase